MTKLIKLTSLLALVLTTSSCGLIIKSNQKEQKLDYIQGPVKMDIKKFFDGDLEGFAIEQDFDGKITETFTAKINGKWEENKGVVKFNYSHNDGTKDGRVWLITVNSDGSFDGVGHDVAKAASGKQAGNVAQSTYSLNMGPRGNKEEVEFEDKLYLVDEKSAILVSNFQSKKSKKANAGKIIFSIKKVAAQQ